MIKTVLEEWYSTRLQCKPSGEYITKWLLSDGRIIEGDDIEGIRGKVVAYTMGGYAESSKIIRIDEEEIV